MKKIVLLILTLACILTSLLVFSSCNNGGASDACKHEFKAPITLKEPSCAEDGYEFTECRLCKYGTIKVLYSLNGGHKIEKIPAVEADCFNEGLTEGEKCSLCGEITIGQASTGKVKHSYSGGTCMVCGASANSEGIEYILNYDGTYSVKSIGSCDSETVVIPSEYEGKSVTAILDGAFKDCKSVKSIEVPNTVKKIGKGAFAGCAKLEKLVLPFIGGSLNTNGIASQATLFGYVFGDEKADGCYQVKQYISKSEGYVVYIPSSLKTVRVANGALPYGTFYGMKSLVSVEIGGDVSVIGNRAFYGCSALEELYLPDTYTAIEDYAFHTCSRLKSIEMSSKVSVIGTYAFANCASLESITIPNGVEIINEATFYKSGITEIVLPTSVTEIGEHAFRESAKLTKITLNNGLAKIGSNAFSQCSALAEINIPSTVTEIGERAFNACVSLEEIKLNEGLETVGDGLFYGCKGLKLIEIPASVTTFGKDMFIGCTSLNELVIDENNPEYASVDGVLYSKDLKTLILYMPGREGEAFEIPSNVVRIEAYAFYSNEGLKSIAVPETVKEIGEYAFANAKITSISLPSSIGSVPARAFYNCASLKEINLSAEIESIGDYAFYGIGIEEYTIPEHITQMGKYAFAKCEKLKTLVIPSTLKKLSEASFYGCISLENISFGGGVQEIGKSAFSNCTALKSVKIGTGITTISGYAFNGCTSLSEIYIPISVVTVGEGAFYKCPETGSIRCEAEEKPSGWNDKWNHSKLAVTWGAIDE